MFLAEPPPSQYDLHFRVFGFPVRVHPWFWIVTLLLAISGSEKADPLATLIWLVVVFVSILIHELGHAFAQRHFGGHSRITLYSLGGLASCSDCDRSPRSQILISLAGPAVGFAFAAVLIAAAMLTGHEVAALDPDNLEVARNWLEKFGENAIFFTVGWKLFGMEGFDSMAANRLMASLLYVNIWWGLVNLLPIYPLDGGQVAREVLTLQHPRRGIIQSLWLSVIAAGTLAVWGVTKNSLFVAFMFGYLAYSSYQTLQAYQRHQA